MVPLRLLRWRFQTYTLTSHRIVLARGVVSRVTESIALDRIQDTVVRRPLADRLIGAGSLEIQSAGRDGTEILGWCPGRIASTPRSSRRSRTTVT